jgi:hypothetical protein
MEIMSKLDLHRVVSDTSDLDLLCSNFTRPGSGHIECLHES